MCIVLSKLIKGLSFKANKSYFESKLNQVVDSSCPISSICQCIMVVVDESSMPTWRQKLATIFPTPIVCQINNFSSDSLERTFKIADDFCILLSELT